MPETGSDFTAEQLLQAFRDRSAELVETLGRGLQWPADRQAGEATEFPLATPPTPCLGPALAFLLKSPDTAAVIAVSSEGGLLPDWCASPDGNQSSELVELGRQLADVLAVASFQAAECRALRVADLGEALGRGGLTPESQVGRVEVRGGPSPDAVLVAGPLARPDELVEGPTAAPEAASPTRDAESPPASAGQRQEVQPEKGLQQLPDYTRSLLKIKLPVMVTLAAARQPVSRILELGPGVIIQFDKSCEETLALEVGDQKVAVGEAVKVGDKFGLRITSMVLPEERFRPVRGKSG